VNNDGKCLICNQNLNIAGHGPTYYDDHETVADCIQALADRIHNLEFKEKMRERAASYDEDDWDW
jgi:hypothetical protein